MGYIGVELQLAMALVGVNWAIPYNQQPVEFLLEVRMWAWGLGILGTELGPGVTCTFRPGACPGPA